MYNTPHKNKNITESVIKNNMSLRNLSSIRQHLFSRDSFSIHADFDIAEESMDLTGNILEKDHPNKNVITSEAVSAVLEKITLSSTSENATFSSCQFSKVENISSGNVNKESVFNIVEKLCQTVRPETESCLNKSAITEKMSECAISGGGDASLIMESCQKFNSIQSPDNKIQKSTSERHEV